jgi:hypoxanthine phosphoribosyltransferase
MELSIENVEKKCNDLYNIINEQYDYELVIFIARGSYLIGKYLSELNDVPLLEIYATRKGGKFKKIIKPLLKIIPKKILIKLRKKEMKSSYHEINNDRQISFDEKKYSEYKSKKKILLVDDSIDSGNTMKLAKQAIEQYFDNADVKIAVFNVMSKATIKVDYYLYRDMMICGPWSNDSKECNKYLKLYNEWKKAYSKKFL